MNYQIIKELADELRREASDEIAKADARTVTGYNNALYLAEAIERSTATRLIAIASRLDEALNA